MSENTNIDETVVAWAEIVIRIWEEKIYQLKVTDTYALLNSFAQHVVLNANGDPIMVEFAFNYYGKFADMSVGKGTSYGEVGNSRRKVKPWYSKTFFNQVRILGEILSEKYARKAALLIVENIDDNSLSWQKS